MSFTYQFNTTCAAVYGVPEAVFIHQLYFWCRVNEKNGRNLHDGRYWSYNSMKALREIFDFWSPSQLETVIKNCRKKGAILTANYCTDPRDRTLSYTITDSVKCIYEKSEMSDGDFRNAFPKSQKCIKGTVGNPTVGNTDILPLFDRFWGAYPRKVSKADARKAFAKLNPDGELVEAMLRALDWQKRLPEWTKDGGQFVPYPATWLNARRWEDEPDGSPTTPTPPERKEDEYTWL